MFSVNNEFMFGKMSFEMAQKSVCEKFILDTDEEECVVSTDTSSCYNCLYRKWTQQSFVCIQRSRNEQKYSF
ncbi:MAG: molybdopterin biosynthesis protein MoeB [Arcobacteraceae bacterium]